LILSFVNIIITTIQDMTKINKQLKVSTVPGFLSQINANSSPDTKIKIKSTAALCLSKPGDKKNLRKAINLYNEAYNIQHDLRGPHHPRTLNILNLIIHCEKKLDHIKTVKNIWKENENKKKDKEKAAKMI